MMNYTLAKNLRPKEFFIKNRQVRYFLIKIIIAAGLIWYIVENINPEEILTAVSSADYYLIFIAFALCFLNLYLQFLKWEIVCKNYLNFNDRKKIFISLFHGFAAGIFTPARIGEYFSRGLTLKEKSVFQIAAATFIDKFFPFLIVIFFGGISFIFYMDYNYHSYYLSILFFAAVLLLVYVFFVAVWKGKFLNYIPDRIKQKNKAAKILLNIEQLKELNFQFTLRMIFISIMFYLCYLIQFAVLITAFSHNFHFIEYMWNGSLIMFTKSIVPQISIGELGIREGVSIYFYRKIGEDAVTAFNASILLFLINLVLPSLIGLILLYKKSDD
jgi:uncharacterized protein (TIRG00374 family)